MDIQNKLKAFLLAARIEYHWSRILSHRKQGKKLLAAGVLPSSGRLLRLNHRIMRHGLLAMQQEKYYETHFVAPAKGSI